MGWRRGELWLDTDILWVGEEPSAPMVAFAPAAVLSPAPPPGLAASRQRREVSRRRREGRRARSKALALSPAVMLALAAARGGDHETSVVVEDPPSLTFRLDRGRAEAADTPRATARHDRVPGARETPSKPEPKRPDRVAPEDAFPKISWHHAMSVGLPWGGSLIGGTQLPVEGPSWVTWNPATDSGPNAPDRLYGNERTIRAIVTVTDAYRAAHPEAARVVIGDISREGGGPMRDEHVSHQNGLDVDIYFPRLDRTLRAPRAPSEIDHRLAQDLLDRFVAAGAQMVFVGYSTGLHGPAGVVIPYPGHENHMHVRFPRAGA
jgi:hypothetical protein